MQVEKTHHQTHEEYRRNKWSAKKRERLVVSLPSASETGCDKHLKRTIADLRLCAGSTCNIRGKYANSAACLSSEPCSCPAAATSAVRPPRDQQHEPPGSHGSPASPGCGLTECRSSRVR